MTLHAPVRAARQAARRESPRHRSAAGGALRACAAIGDAAALIRRDDCSLAATTPAWCALLPSLPEGASHDALEQV
ncbi:MAG TPA: hypothetical protein VLE94_16650, partial [Burkholderiaceae bacterium]|nr:hypothetical protein [Burkholderiaceae bacterium]